MLFLIYVPVQLIIVQPDSIFKPWERFALFVFLMICVSPLIRSDELSAYRIKIFEISAIFCVFLGVGSFFARFLGINYSMHGRMDFLLNVGVFGGLTRHSMLLGPIAGIGSIYCIWKGMLLKDKLYWILGAFCLIAVMFSASRSSLMASIAGLTIVIYKLSHSGAGFVKICVAITLIGAISFPIWGQALDSVIMKNEANIAAGSALSSRDALWDARISEFKNSPVLGVGFDALDLGMARQVEGFDEQSGVVESGSSWLTILSMTGILGTVILIPFLIKTYVGVYRESDDYAALLCGVLTLFYVHMIAEGYIFFGGSMLAFLLWLTIGVSYDCRFNDD